MSYRTTIILLIILSLLGILVYFRSGEKPPGGHDFGPEVWSVEESKINRIEIRLPHMDQAAAFVKDSDDAWYFDEAKHAPVDKDRWAGILLLLSGPGSKRLIAEKTDNPAAYGFEKPQMEIILNVQDQGTLKIVVGDHTPNHENFYVKLRDYHPIFIVDDSWKAALERLVTVPPRTKPE